MRWEQQKLETSDAGTIPGLPNMQGFVRSIQTPEFAGLTFHEVMAKSALNNVPSASAMPFNWTINPYRGCSHQCAYCFARKTHEYLDLDAGADFDSQIVVKVNVVDVLRRELARPTWECEHVALGTNTDPYQRAEGRYQLMPGIIQALTDAGTPFSILTKGTLVRRDLPLLADAAQQVSVGLRGSRAIWETALHETIEPGTPSRQARLALVRAAREAGLPCGVFLAPVLPWLTDSTEQLDAALAQLADAGASGVTVLPLHLRPGAREWFLRWLQQAEPGLVPRYEALYRRGAYVPGWYKKQLWRRIGPLLRKHGFDRKAQREPDEGHYPEGSMAEEATAAQTQPSPEDVPRQLSLL